MSTNDELYTDLLQCQQQELHIISTCTCRHVDTGTDSPKCKYESLKCL